MSDSDSDSGAGDQLSDEDVAADPRASVQGALPDDQAAALAKVANEAAKDDQKEEAPQADDKPKAKPAGDDAATPPEGMQDLWDMPTKPGYENMSIQEIMKDMANPETAEAEATMKEKPLPTAQDLFERINSARTDPEATARALEERLKYYDAKEKLFGFPDKDVKLDPYEEDAAYKEAIEFLRNEVPKGLEPLKLEIGLNMACAFQTKDGKETGQTGHMSSDGSSPVDRMEKYGKFEEGNVAESINYPRKDYTATDIILGFIADDGVKSRANRTNIFNADMKVVGMSVDEHKDRGRMCVMLFCEKYETKNTLLDESDKQMVGLEEEFGDMF